MDLISTLSERAGPTDWTNASSTPPTLISPAPPWDAAVLTTDLSAPDWTSSHQVLELVVLGGAGEDRFGEDTSVREGGVASVLDFTEGDDL